MMGAIEEIRAGGLSLGVAPAVGGCMAWLRSEQADGSVRRWLREADDPWTEADPRAFGCFAMTPFCNRVAEARFTLDGREIRLQPNFPPEPHMIHGVGWTSAWEVLSRRADALTLGLAWDGADWPWRFQAWLDYALTPDALSVTLKQTNMDQTPMPSGLGLHPYFPYAPGLSLRAPAPAQALVLNDARMLPTALDPDASALAALNSGAALPVGLDNGIFGWDGMAEICWPETGARLRIEAAPASGWAVVYVPEGKGYFCFEPVSHQTDAHNRRLEGVAETGLETLGPGESQSMTVRFTPEA